MLHISSSSSLPERSQNVSIPIHKEYNNQTFPNRSGNLTFAESVFISCTNSNNQYDLAQSSSGPFNMSPPNHFMEKLQKRIDKYYSKDKGENCLSFTTRA